VDDARHVPTAEINLYKAVDFETGRQDYTKKPDLVATTWLNGAIIMLIAVAGIPREVHCGAKTGVSLQHGCKL